jgi:DNA-binding XRE family transcriptional regulator
MLVFGLSACTENVCWFKITKSQDAKQYLVFPRSIFKDDYVVPSQKPKSCAHRAKLGGNIAALRGRRKLTQEQLAEKTGVSARYIQSLEAGEYFPSLPKLVKLKSALRCSWNEIFAGCEKI